MAWRLRVPQRLPRLTTLVASALPVLMPLVLFHRALSGRLVVAGLDLVTYFYPYRVAAARAIEQGRLPFWNPDLYGGVPFLANMQAGVFYPLNVLFVVIPGPQAITWSIIIHLALAGILFYAFCRRALALPPIASVVGALAFSASGFALTQTDHLNQNNVLAWMPGVVLAVDQAYRRRSRAWALLLAVFVTLQVFAGHPQEQYYTAVVAAAWLVQLVVRDRKIGWREIGRRLTRPVIGGALGLGIAAVQLIPTFELTHYGIRSGGVSFTEANFLAIPFHDLLASLVPDYSTVVPVEWAASIGLIPLLLAVVAVVRRWREGPVLLLAGLALTAIGVALGRATPIFWLAYHLLPGYVSFRVPPRALLVFTFAAAALAAFGAAELEKQRARGDHPWIVLAVAGALFVAAFPVFWWLQRNGPLPVLSTFLPGHRWILLARWLALIAAAVALAVVARRWPVVSAGLILLVAGELYLAARPLDALKPLPAGIYSRDPRIDALLPSDSTPFRSLSVDQATSARPSIPQAELGRLGYVDDFRYANSRAARVGDWPNFPMQAGRATLDGYDGGLLPLTSYVRFRGLLVPAGRNLADYPFPYLMAEVPDQRLLGLLGVRYVLHDPAPADAGAPVVEGVSILENPQVLPRAFLVHTVHASAGSDRDLQAIANPDFDLRSEATIAEGVCSGGQPATGDQVELLDSSPETLSLRVASASPSLLVVGTVDYPGWQASVDGKSQPVLLADSLIQGVCLPPGRHTVELRFTPSHWTLALALSLASFAALVVFTAWPIRRTSAGRGAISPQPEPIDSRAGPSLL